jgi:hypothetical protein
MRDQRRRYDSNEFAPKRRHCVCLPLNNGERLFEPEWLAPQTEFELWLTGCGHSAERVPFRLAKSTVQLSSAK